MVRPAFRKPACSFGPLGFEVAATDKKSLSVPKHIEKGLKP
jgi:hypothetical protein